MLGNVAATMFPRGADRRRLFTRASSNDEVDALAAVREIFTGVVEPLCDSFLAEAVDAYVSFFLDLIEHCRGLESFAEADGALNQAALPGRPEIAQRYESIRQGPQRPATSPKRIYFLSRVTIGADVAVTSVFLRYFEQAYPQAERVLVGSAKLGELYGGDESLRWLELPYERRGTLAARLEAWVRLREMLAADAAGLAAGDWVVLDPDSRLTQLGLLPVGPDQAAHWFFESRAYGAGTSACLASLARRWLGGRFGTSAAAVRPYVAPGSSARERVTAKIREQPDPLAVVNFGTGGNEAKSAGFAWEAAVLRLLASRGYRVVIDAGFGDVEHARAAALRREAGGGQFELLQSSVAELAALIERAQVYVGYDSAGSHLAAALGVHCVDVFYKPLSALHQARWTPDSTAPVHVVTLTGSGDTTGPVAQALP